MAPTTRFLNPISDAGGIHSGLSTVPQDIRFRHRIHSADVVLQKMKQTESRVECYDRKLAGDDQ